MDAPPVNLSTANGEPLPNCGAHRIFSYTRSGHRVGRVFYDANVEMPILAVSELSKEGPRGSEIQLRANDGFIRDLSTGFKQPVVKRRGVYFTKLLVKKSSPGFTRPGQP